MNIKQTVDRIKQLTDQLARFLTSILWSQRFSRKHGKLAHYLKVSFLTLSSFFGQKVNYRAIALAYFSILALVPCVAMIFAVTNGFGLGAQMESILYQYFEGKEAIIATILEYSNNILNTINNGVFGLFVFLSFVWMVLWLMIQVESAFNYVWNVKKSRSFLKRAGAYMSILIILPFVLLMFMSTLLLFSHGNGLMQLLRNIPILNHLGVGISWIGTYLMTTLVLSIMYKFIPAVKVQYVNAIKSALFTAVFFCIFQWIYFESQLFINRLSGVFGAIAAIPFLMIWLNYSWLMVLFGSELTYAFQNVNTYTPGRFHDDDWEG